ncbi:retron St85 family effector protein [Acutalibacter intestini]|uniref:retron St85 family effector protein n=1 Tax=Acutalibacter intestini TaxID=3093659 RepID=UPI002AC9EA42|nr:retron St85 family effector protein [Acutalibacter sp. M00204]
MDCLDIFKQIYDDVFLKVYAKSIYLFLCGGAGKDNVRNKVRSLLEKEDLRIFYPEDLFMELLNRNKYADLLEYENLLAQNADIICVLCESFGSAVELGAFCQVDAIRDKMIVGIEKRYARDRSFIMLGPIKHIQKERKDAVIEYRKDALDDLVSAIVKQAKRMKRQHWVKETPSFSSLSFYISFIPLALFFYRSINRNAVFNGIKNMIKMNGNLPKEYNDIFNASIKYLLNSNVIETTYRAINQSETEKSKKSPQYKEILSLSQKGYHITSAILQTSTAREKTILHDQIRCAIMRRQK